VLTRDQQYLKEQITGSGVERVHDENVCPDKEVKRVHDEQCLPSMHRIEDL